MKAAPFVLLLLALASCQEAREPFTGAHQAGITTPAQKFAFVAAFDVTAATADEVRELFKIWSRAANALTQGLPLGTDATLSAPSHDTGEVLGYRPARLTLTFGVGPSLFDGRFGLAVRRPAALAPLPAFNGDQLKPEWSDGDLVVQVCADDYETAYHALHTLTRAAKGRAVARWVQDGFQPGLEVNPKGPGRNLEGFIDGTNNPDTTKPEVMDQVVWVGGDDWMKGGSYLVVRRIRMLVEVWDRSSQADQQRTIGRERTYGKELEAQAPDSHVLTVRGAGVEKILRRPFHFVNGLDGHTGQWDSGLLFLAWMKDPRAQFVPMQTRMADFDLLNEYIKPVGSAVFAMFPGPKEGSYVGATLLPDTPLSAKIEALLGAVGATYPALAAGDWTAVRNGAGEWNSLWRKQREDAGERSKTIDALRDAWALSLAEELPRGSEVRAAQSALVKALVEWEKAAAPVSLGSATDLQGLKNELAAASKAVEAGNAPQARTAFLNFQKQWVSKEALVRSLDASAYSAVEVGTATARLALIADQPGKPALEALKALSDRLASLKSPQAFGAWDAGFLLFREGLEALLVLAALLTFLSRTDQKKRTPWVWAGAGTGLGASVLVAVAISMIMTGWTAAAAPTLVEGITGLAAVVLMLSVGMWLHGKATVKNWNVWMKEQMGKVGNSGWALAALACLAVLREGAETVVFFWGLAGSLSTVDLIVGVAGAFAVLGIMGVLMIGFSKRLPLQWFFPLATALIYFLAVKMLGQSLSALQAAGILGASPLGFGAPIDFLGFTPTWQSAGPQFLLFVVLTALVVVPMLKRPKAAVKTA